MQQGRGLQRFDGALRSGRSLALALATVVLLAGCTQPDAEQAVRARIDDMQAAIDARDAGDVHDLLAEDFVGNDGLDRRGARQLAAGVFLRHRDVAVRLGPVEVELRGERDAVARFTVAATGGSGGLLPDRGQVYRIETGWRLVEGEWRLLSASWKAVL